MAHRTFIRQLNFGESSWHAFISHSETADILETTIPIGGMQNMTLHESYNEVLDAFRDTSKLHFPWCYLDSSHDFSKTTIR